MDLIDESSDLTATQNGRITILMQYATVRSQTPSRVCVCVHNAHMHRFGRRVKSQHTEPRTHHHRLQCAVSNSSEQRHEWHNIARNRIRLSETHIVKRATEEEKHSSAKALTEEQQQQQRQQQPQAIVQNQHTEANSS